MTDKEIERTILEIKCTLEVLKKEIARIERRTIDSYSAEYEILKYLDIEIEKLYASKAPHG